MEHVILELQDTVARWERNAQHAANAAAQRQGQPVPSPEQLGAIVEGLAVREAHSDRLAVENQEIILAWENISLRIIPHPNDIPPTPDQAAERLEELMTRTQPKAGEARPENLGPSCNHRSALASALGLLEGTSWDDLLAQVKLLLARNEPPISGDAQSTVPILETT
ncbi:hypothetical protein QBC43DRAFT_291977 [Cladorrhinum sp. PSN259]|nr:hypothetical protein QBC43DRAFT_291977 [Cladorrhinum sp. PSN259]